MKYASGARDATPRAKATVVMTFTNPRSADDTSSAGNVKLTRPYAPVQMPAATRHVTYKTKLGAVNGAAASTLNNVKPKLPIMMTSRRPRWSANTPPTKLPTRSPAMNKDCTRSDLYASPHTSFHCNTEKRKVSILLSGWVWKRWCLQFAKVSAGNLHPVQPDNC